MNFLVWAIFFLWPIYNYCQALKEVNIKIPTAVIHGYKATLMCPFDLEGDKLYSVKWYHGSSEFYRYTPSNDKPLKTFRIKGFHVVEDESNATQVVLKHVTRDIAGQFSCEVTADQPSFYTIMKTANLMVVDLPSEDPYITGLKKRYRLGDLIKANCTSERSYPGVNITWYVNGRHIDGPQVHKYRREVDQNYITSISALRMKINDNFIEGEQVKVRCAASMYHLYHRSEERIINIERRHHHHRNIKSTTTEETFPDHWTIQDGYSDHTLVFGPVSATAANLSTSTFQYVKLLLVLMFITMCLR